jgi:crotonobetainyl-CoA:carnitine CoA-transferase CaiB-like acyl-CoA transferase
MARLTAAIGARGRDELGAALDAAGVPQGPVRAVDEILAGEHAAARELVERFTHPQIGEFPALRVPLKFDGWDDPTVDRPPLLGEHTESVLGERLGLSRERIAQLKEAKAI